MSKTTDEPIIPAFDFERKASPITVTPVVKVMFDSRNRNKRGRVIPTVLTAAQAADAQRSTDLKRARSGNPANFPRTGDVCDISVSGLGAYTKRRSHPSKVFPGAAMAYREKAHQFVVATVKDPDGTLHSTVRKQPTVATSL